MIHKIFRYIIYFMIFSYPFVVYLSEGRVGLRAFAEGAIWIWLIFTYVYKPK